MTYRGRMALPGLVLSLSFLAIAQPRAAHAAAPHHSPRKPVHRVIHHAAAPALPIWSDASGNWRQTGMASWYGGKRWQGRRTTSGERYDENQLTAAHASLPLGSRVRVVVARTGRSVVVTINDRGPFIRGRVLDLSTGAARAIGLTGAGVGRVTAEVVS